MSLTIRTKLYAMAGGLLVALAVVGVLSIANLGSVNAAGQAMYEDGTVPTQRLGQVSTSIVDAHRSLLRQLLYAGDADIAREETAKRKEDAEVTNSALAALAKMDLPVAERKALEEFRPIILKYRATRDEALRLADTGQDDAKLAEESQSATASIAELIGQIHQETQRAVEVVEAGARQTSDGAATVEGARDSFIRIRTAIGDMSGRVGEISAAIRQIADASQKVQEDISDVASVAEQSSAAAEQVSAAAQQTSASTQEIAASAQELAGTSEALARLVAQFTLDARGTFA